jgi:hypothetical protein
VSRTETHDLDREDPAVATVATVAAETAAVLAQLERLEEPSRESAHR